MYNPIIVLKVIYSIFYKINISWKIIIAKT